ncbi:MAG: glycosyltransferase [Verrucomicrobiae bacterium]|nr:glycosyltransferase [Verrucomicrobiae bacterium]NNJ42955.1 glycosyltransferase [Akkermansiaceae bacterium]
MRLLLIFLKEPIPGQVKTRLASDVGNDNAARYYKALVEVLLRQLQGLNHCRIRFCHSPDDAGDAVRFWLLPEMRATAGPTEDVFLAPSSQLPTPPTQEVDFRAQRQGDTGSRLERAFAEGFNDGFSEIAAIGSDCPDCGARWINAAFSRLAAKTSRHAIIGPNTRGGYYLLALKAHAPQLFDRIPWNQSNVLEATLSAAQSDETPLTTELLPELRDVDNLNDWQHINKSPLGAALKKALGETIS